MSTNYSIYNEQIISSNSLCMPGENRGSLYGDGIFETFCIKNGEIRFLSDHWARLNYGVETLGMVLPDSISEESLDTMVKNLIHKNNLSDKSSLRGKLMLWRAGEGQYTPLSNKVHYAIRVSTLNPSIKHKRVGIYDDIKLIASKISSLKTISALTYVMASIRKSELAYDDMIILDHRNNVAECTYSNVFWIKKNKVYTPHLDSGCVAGVMRKNILKILTKEKVEFETGLYPIEALFEADGIFTCNALQINYISCIDDKEFTFPHPIVERLIRLIQL